MLTVLRPELIRLLAAIASVSALVVATAATPALGVEKKIYSFRGGDDGALPYGGLIADKHGNLYGSTIDGGTGTLCDDTTPGCGTLFKIAKDGRESVLYSFQGGSDGWGPMGSLFADATGTLFGATNVGGGSDACEYGCGIIFKLPQGGKESVLYAFQGMADGQYPQGSLIADVNGNLYGVTTEGGNYNGSECAEAGCGTVFEVQPNGSKITLYAFQGGTDGVTPVGGLVADASGNLYGTTGAGGGSGCGGDGCGTVFKLTPDGTESVVYAFQGGNDGDAPLAGLIMDNGGNLYGTTWGGGEGSNSCSNCGIVFEVSPAGVETKLYAFKDGNDGANPEAGVIMDASGNLFGTTHGGGGVACGREGCGTVFKLAPNGNETVLYAFAPSHGRNPVAPLLLGKHKLLYGTTTGGGGHQDGVVFQLKQ